MVYYNPDEEFPFEFQQGLTGKDIDKVINYIDAYIEYYFKIPKNKIYDEKICRIKEKRFGLERLKVYLIEHRFEDHFMNLIDNFICEMNNKAAWYPHESKSYKFYSNMRDAAEELACTLL